MAHAVTNYANVINFADFETPARARGLFARLAQAVSDYRAYLEVRTELNALSNRELADLGISRLNVRDVAREAVYGR